MHRDELGLACLRHLISQEWCEHDTATIVSCSATFPDGTLTDFGKDVHVFVQWVEDSFFKIEVLLLSVSLSPHLEEEVRQQRIADIHRFLRTITINHDDPIQFKFFEQEEMLYCSHQWHAPLERLSYESFDKQLDHIISKLCGGMLLVQSRVALIANRDPCALSLLPDDIERSINRVPC